MSCFSEYLQHPTVADSISVEELRELVKRYNWFTTARVALEFRSAERDPFLELLFMVLPKPSLLFKSIEDPQEPSEKANNSQKNSSKSMEVVDKFLSLTSVHASTPLSSDGEDLAAESVVDDLTLISEELAEIYLNQGLKKRAMEIYRKLSLLYPEKSVYFAEIIDRINRNNKSQISKRLKTL